MLEALLSALLTGASTMYLCGRKKKTGEKLSLPIGDILVEDGGVTCNLNEPLSGMSRHYPWRFVPTVMEEFHALATGEREAMILSTLRESEKDMLESVLGRVEYVIEEESIVLEHDSDVLESVEALLEWLPTIAEQSHSSVAERLRSMLR